MSFKRGIKKRYLWVTHNVLILSTDRYKLDDTRRHVITTLKGENYKFGFLHTNLKTKKLAPLSVEFLMVAPF
jgi:hypothetical protein